MRLSVIVPVYNGRDFIGRCLRSIASQTFRDLEIIIVDDGSTDGTEDMIRAMCAAEPVMKSIPVSIIRQDHQGTYAARIAGAREAAGEWTGFADADDWIEPDFYERLFAALDSNGDMAGEPVMVCCGLTEETASGKKAVGGERRGIIRKDDVRMEMLCRHAVYAYAVNKIFRRGTLSSVVVPDGNPIAEDLDMMLQITSPPAGDVIVTEGRGYHYVRRRDSRTLSRFGEEKKQGFYNLRRAETEFDGPDEEKAALARYLMIEYVSCLLQMYRSKVRDAEMEKEILRFVSMHRHDFIRRSGDGFAARACVALLNPLSSRLFFAIWPRLY